MKWMATMNVAYIVNLFIRKTFGLICFMIYRYVQEMIHPGYWVRKLERDKVRKGE